MASAISVLYFRDLTKLITKDNIMNNTTDWQDLPIEFRSEAILIVDGPERWTTPAYVAYRDNTPVGLAIAHYSREWNAMPGYRGDEGFTLVHVPAHRYIHDELYVATNDLDEAKQWLEYAAIMADYREKRVRIVHDYGEAEPVLLGERYHAATATFSEFALMVVRE
jgi:hypothetical protein